MSKSLIVHATHGLLTVCQESMTPYSVLTTARPNYGVGEVIILLQRVIGSGMTFSAIVDIVNSYHILIGTLDLSALFRELLPLYQKLLLCCTLTKFHCSDL